MTRCLAFQCWWSESSTVLYRLVSFGPPWWLRRSYLGGLLPKFYWHSPSRRLLAGRFLNVLEEPSLRDPSVPSSSPSARFRDIIPLGGHSVDGSRAYVWSQTVVDSPDTKRDSRRQTLHPLIICCFWGPQGSPIIILSSTCNKVKKPDRVVSPAEPSQALASPGNTSECFVRWQQGRAMDTDGDSPSLPHLWHHSTSPLALSSVSTLSPTSGGGWLPRVFPRRPRFAGVAIADYKSAFQDRQALDRMAWGAIVLGRRWTKRERAKAPLSMPPNTQGCQTTMRTRTKTRATRASDISPHFAPQKLW